MGRRVEDEAVELDVLLRAETDRALLVHDGAVEAWLPKSQVEWDGALVVGKTVRGLTAPLWLAEEKGLA